MDTIVCPVECVGVGCDQPDFIERNGAWLLTIDVVQPRVDQGLSLFRKHCYNSRDPAPPVRYQPAQSSG